MACEGLFKPEVYNLATSLLERSPNTPCCLLCRAFAWCSEDLCLKPFMGLEVFMSIANLKEENISFSFF